VFQYIEIEIFMKYLLFCQSKHVSLYFKIKKLMNTTYNPNEEEILLLEEEVKPGNQLILFNDDVNTFDWVIESLIKVCNHELLQAEQCSLVIHYAGKCAVKEGGLRELKPMCEALQDRGLSAVIE
jgi:ATP-dependent Clp protease adaptor protein ClpS